jgi:hypothetical protein
MSEMLDMLMHLAPLLNTVLIAGIVIAMIFDIRKRVR